MHKFWISFWSTFLFNVGCNKDNLKHHYFCFVFGDEIESYNYIWVFREACHLCAKIIVLTIWLFNNYHLIIIVFKQIIFLYTYSLSDDSDQIMF